jgi:hypothetical protein
MQLRISLALFRMCQRFVANYLGTNVQGEGLEYKIAHFYNITNEKWEIKVS